MYKLVYKETELCIIQAVVGSGSIAMMTDWLFANDVEVLLCCGCCGVLADIPAGDVIIPTRALRGEGASYQYLPPSRYVELHQQPHSSAAKYSGSCSIAVIFLSARRIMTMYSKIEEWLNNLLEQEIPSETVAFCFNLYEDAGDAWSLELVGTGDFDDDPGNPDWACEEVTDFDTREAPLSWEKEAEWDEILDDVITALKQYLETGIHADILKAYAGVGVGFVDGDMEILYTKE